MAPKTTKENGTEVEANVDAIGLLAKDATLWRFMVRYAKETDIPVNVAAIKRIGGLPHTTAYRKLTEAKKAEGVDDDTSGTTTKAAGAPKKTSKRKLAAEDVDGDDEPKAKQGKKSAGSNVKAEGKKRTARSAKKNVVVNDNAGGSDEPVEDMQDEAKPKERARKPSARKGKKSAVVDDGAGESDAPIEGAQQDVKPKKGGKIVLTKKPAKKSATPVVDEEKASDGADDAVMSDKEPEPEVKQPESEVDEVKEEVADSVDGVDVGDGAAGVDGVDGEGEPEPKVEEALSEEGHSETYSECDMSEAEDEYDDEV